MVQKYLRPAAIKAGVLKEEQRVRFGFHNFRHSLASALVKLKCDPKTVQGILRHEDVKDDHAALRTVGPRIEASGTGQVPGTAPRGQGALADGDHSMKYPGLKLGLEITSENIQVLWNDGGQGRS